MAKEIERKFLIDVSQWGYQGNPIKMKQAYLVIQEDKVIRVRITEQKAFLTIKGNLDGITRDEFEYEIPIDDAKQMLNMSEGAVVSKTRYLYEHGNHVWEIDVFDGDNQGLVVAEIELKDESEDFKKPTWLKEEVSTDVKYYNFSLSKNPYCNWQ